jgi:hypothetical protein
MANRTGKKNVLGHLMKQMIPVYQKAGVHHIDTEAMGEDGSHNGNHSWASAGFGFQHPEHLESTRRNALSAIQKYGNNPDLLDEANAATHPFHFQNIAKQLARRNPGSLKAKQHFNMMLKEPFSDDNPDHGSFKGRLSLDPNDVGYQEFQKHFNRYNK